MIKEVKSFIATGCWHVGLSNGSRLDNVKETHLKSIESLFKFANKNEVDLILHGGDFFDVDFLEISQFEDVLYLMNKYNIDKHRFQLIGGNHDIYQKNPKFLNKSTIQILLKLYDMDYENIQKFNFGEEWTNNKVDFTLIHHFIDNNNVDSIFNTFSNSKYIISADHHKHFLYENDRGQMLLNPGHLIRCASNEPHPKFYYVKDGVVSSIALPDVDNTVFNKNSKQLVDKLKNLDNTLKDDIKKIASSNGKVTNSLDGYKEFMKKSLTEIEYQRFILDLEQ